MIFSIDFRQLEKIQADCLSGADPFEDMTFLPRKDWRGFSVFTKGGARYATFIFPGNEPGKEEHHHD